MHQTTTIPLTRERRLYRLSGCVLAIALVLAGPVRAQQTVGSWTLSETKDPMTDVRKVKALTLGSPPSPLGQQPRLAAINESPHQVSAGIGWGTFLAPSAASTRNVLSARYGAPILRVEARFDQGDVLKYSMLLQANGAESMVPAKNLGDFLHYLATSKTLVVRALPGYMAPLTYTFNLEGFAALRDRYFNVPPSPELLAVRPNPDPSAAALSPPPPPFSDRAKRLLAELKSRDAAQETDSDAPAAGLPDYSVVTDQVQGGTVRVVSITIEGEIPEQQLRAIGDCIQRGATPGVTLTIISVYFTSQKAGENPWVNLVYNPKLTVNYLPRATAE